MRAFGHQELGQFAPKGLDWQDLSGGALDIAILKIYDFRFFFHNTCSYIDPGVW